MTTQPATLAAAVRAAVIAHEAAMAELAAARAAALEAEPEPLKTARRAERAALEAGPDDWDMAERHRAAVGDLLKANPPPPRLKAAQAAAWAALAERAAALEACWHAARAAHTAADAAAYNRALRWAARRAGLVT